MRKLFHETLTVMSNAFRRLEAQVEPPETVPHRDSFVYRYKEKGIEQALLQKLARSISGLYAVDLLLVHGFVQEQGVLERTLDEIHQDIFFLTGALTNGTITEQHQQYLKAFYADTVLEEFDATERATKPNPVPRKKVRAYVTRVLAQDPNPSRAADIGETISTAYSGYVHAASSNIMDMYGGDPPHFHIAGMRGTSVAADYVHVAWDYYYRGLLAVTAVAKAYGDKSLVDTLDKYIARFEAASGSPMPKPRGKNITNKD